MTYQVRCLDELPAHLAERCRIAHDAPVAGANEYVLYWMCSAVRTEENPALDTAILLAQHLDVPLLVYHGLSQSYPWASDRHHTFILQGARDVQRQFAERGIRYVFHLEQHGQTSDALSLLAERSCVVVTEEMPTGPHALFLRGLISRTQRPIVAVDSSCVVPMRLVGRAFERAFQFRDATQKRRQVGIQTHWPGLSDSPRYFQEDVLPFTPVDLQTCSLAELVANCRIDHSIGQVVDTPGGSVAGYERWATFLKSGLKYYAARRNNPLMDGVSRMSAYLHYGMVSPLRMAREVAAMSGEGAEKFLEELLIWRELAWGFCFYRPDHADWSAIPAWAQKTLLQHASDKRPAVYSREQLARSATHDVLWNAAQDSLRIHGELHNNVRMTWGKAILDWTQCPREALRTILDLNHRYALDGRDPSSFGGILWCLGQFDRPFSPELPILGTVRPRPTTAHAERLDVSLWSRKTSTPRCNPVPAIAVIGAGISGIMAARTLVDHGLPVTVFEKSRGFGGRMATRRREAPAFDHGVQSFHARDPRFRRCVNAWKEQGLIATWNGEFAEVRPDGVWTAAPRQTRLVGVPGMSDLVRHLADGLDVHRDQQIHRLAPVSGRIRLSDAADGELGIFDQVILAVPVPQAVVLLDSFGPFCLPSMNYDTIWTLMLVLPEPLNVTWNAVEVFGSPIRRIARNQTKPGRHAIRGEEHLVIHSSPEWGSAHREDAEADVRTQLMEILGSLLQRDIGQPAATAAHRWRFAKPAQTTRANGDLLIPTPGEAPVNQPSPGVSLQGLADQGVFLCGDGIVEDQQACCGVEAAFLSGINAAGRVLGGLRKEQKIQRGLW